MNKLSIFLLAILLASCAAPTQPVQPATVEPPPPTTATPVSIDDVIEWEMRTSFDFFWEQANTTAGSPGFGLIRDRYPGSEGIASIASVGYGLTAFTVGVEKGYITSEQACERVEGTFDTLLALDREHGFYFHFLDIETGERAWSSEVSTIDTAILIMGVLTAGQYCGGGTWDKADEIYTGVDWPWFLDENRNMFYMAYRPGEGFAGHWDFYAEQLMMYVLAAGSPSHPIDPLVYYSFIRHTAGYGEGQPFIHSWFGSLFTYQYSHAWIDFRGLTDTQGVNWFDNSVKASQAHYDFAVDNDDEFLGLGPLAWGLTACDSPHGYEGLLGAPPSGYDNTQHLVDDTIAPAAAVGSIIFLPEQAKAAMLYYFSLPDLQGSYGFIDSFNLTEDWFDEDVIGIDKGIGLLMLANYQDDMVYRITAQVGYFQQGLERLGFTESTPR